MSYGFKILIAFFSVFQLLIVPLQASDHSWRQFSEDERTEFLQNFTPHAHEGYKRLNERDELIERLGIKTGLQGGFYSMTDVEYKKFIAESQLFDTKLDGPRKIFNLMLWAQMAGCPLLALSEYSEFFYAGIQLYTPARAKDVLGRIDFKDDQRDKLKDLFGVYPYASDENGNPRIGVKYNQDKDNVTYRTKSRKELGPDVILYQYAPTSKASDQQTFKEFANSYYTTHQNPPKIAYDLLKEYIIPLDKIDYLDDVLKGVSCLPKRVVDLMRGKAIYLSAKEGRGRHLQETSENKPITTYLGLIPGIFLENNKKEPNNRLGGRTLNSIMVVHETGHMIDYTVLRDRLDMSIPWFYEFPAFWSDLEQRDQLFKKNEKYRERIGNTGAKTTPGYMTNYAESSAAEDFAEHFTYYILNQKDFNATAQEEVNKKNNPLLSKKFNFMQKLMTKPFKMILASGQQDGQLDVALPAIVSMSLNDNPKQ